MSERQMGHSSAYRSRNWLLIAGAIAGPFFVAAWSVLDQTRPGFDWMRRQVSELALGPLGWQMDVVFVVYGCLTVAFGIGLLAAQRPRRLVAISVVAWGVAFIVAGFFATAPSAAAGSAGGGHSSSSAVHDMAAGVAFLSMTVAAIVSGVRYIRGARIGLGIYSIASAILTLAFLTVSSIGFAQAPGFFDVAGIFERLALATALLWQTVLALDTLRARRS